jgi:hypothetical protein
MLKKDVPRYIKDVLVAVEDGIHTAKEAGVECEKPIVVDFMIFVNSDEADPDSAETVKFSVPLLGRYKDETAKPLLYSTSLQEKIEEMKLSSAVAFRIPENAEGFAIPGSEG